MRNTHINLIIERETKAILKMRHKYRGEIINFLRRCIDQEVKDIMRELTKKGRKENDK